MWKRVMVGIKCPSYYRLSQKSHQNLHCVSLISVYINETYYSLYKPLMCSEMFYGHKVPPYLILAPREKTFLLNGSKQISGSLETLSSQNELHMDPVKDDRRHLTVGLLSQTGTPPLTHTLNIPSYLVGELALVVTSQKGIMSASRLYTLPR